MTCLLLALIGFTTILSCKKSQVSDANDSSTILKHSKSIPEIGLIVDVSYLKQHPDSLNLILSNNFTLEQINHQYNAEQERAYFTLRCKKNGEDRMAYFINGTIDSKLDAITISYATVNID